ncbi:unnamed protein product [Rotaria magnacalcarata]
MLRIKAKTNEDHSDKSIQYVPLKNVNIEATIRSFAADVKIRQAFRNEENTPIEAIYCFPIEERAAIYSFVAHIDDREIIAELKEKKQAQKEYCDGIKSGHGAYLLEQNEDSCDIFMINVGGIPPSKECIITIAYVSELELASESTIRFVVPTAIAPRYDPGKGSISSSANVNYSYVHSTLYTIAFNCRIENIGQQITRINSTSHPIEVDQSQTDAYLVRFTQENTYLDRDILLDIELKSKHESSIIAVESGAVMAAFIPTDNNFCQPAISNNEFIFIVDCSGSMGGENKISYVREAMVVFLRSLPIDCHFNIIRFGSNYESLFEESTVIYNEENVKKAEQLIEKMEANMGGTELLQPLKWLAQNAPGQGRGRQIFLLTDGEISNVSEVLDLCRSMASNTRIFSFGLGQSPSHSLIKGLARATNGQFVFIPPNTNVDEPVCEQLSRALRPCITNVHIKWNLGVEVRNAPRRLPPIYFNERLIVYGLVEDKTIPFNHKSSVELETHPDHHQLVIAQVTRVPTVCDHTTIARLAAKALILELQHEKDLSKGLNTDMQVQDISLSKEIETMSTKHQIIQLSLKYNILSPYTAFVGIEKRINENNDGMVLREIPIQLSMDDQSSQSIVPPIFNNVLSSHASTQYLLMCASHSISSPTYSSTFQNYSSGSPAYSPSYPSYSPTSPTSSSTFQTYSSGSPAYSPSSPSYSPTSPTCLPTATDFVSSSLAYGSASAICSQKHSSILSSNLDDMNANDLPAADAKKRKCNANGDDDDWPKKNRDIVRHLIKKQTFDGLWDLESENIEHLTGKPLANFQSKYSQFDDKTLISLIVIAAFSKYFKALELLWHAVVEKARTTVANMIKNQLEDLDALLSGISEEL